MQNQASAPTVLEALARALSAAGYGKPAGGQQAPDLSGERKFHSVAEVAGMFGISEMGIYRAIHAGKFPAVRVGLRRYFVPARAIEAMVDAAMTRGQMVDAADWAATPVPTAEGVA
ncbi:helix-turn-helix transcriptional regulator [Nonomuraea typhae]|uniref:Helix-turn-helix transcriptional regulator n=1 Tax=Nonomuraea typhae TaxID=2603600 RepID=A0ABW7Z874_9ACTN